MKKKKNRRYLQMTESQKLRNLNSNSTNKPLPLPGLSSELPSLPPLLNLSENGAPQKTIHGSEKSERKPEPKPGFSAVEEKRLLRVQGELEESLMGVAVGMGMLPFFTKRRRNHDAIYSSIVG
jgi:hypothetical protein